MEDLINLMGGDNGMLAKYMAWMFAIQTILKGFAGLLLKLQDIVLERVASVKNGELTEFVEGVMSHRNWHRFAAAVDFFTRAKLRTMPLKEAKPADTNKIAALFLCGSILMGCGTVVKTSEDTLVVAKATGIAFLKLEHSNRELVKSKYPEVHKYAEWLREDVDVTVLDEKRKISRFFAMLIKVEVAKEAVKNTSESEDKLSAALEELSNEIPKLTEYLGILKGAVK